MSSSSAPQSRAYQAGVVFAIILLSALYLRVAFPPTGGASLEYSKQQAAKSEAVTHAVVEWPGWPPTSDVDAFEAEFKAAEARNRRDDSRRPSSPIITGDGFMAVADLSCAEDGGGCKASTIAPWAAAHPGEAAVVFVKGGMTEEFVAEMLPQIRVARLRFVLVVHNSDGSMPHNSADIAALEDPLLIACFAQNVVEPRVNVRPIPIVRPLFVWGNAYACHAMLTLHTSCCRALRTATTAMAAAPVLLLQDAVPLRHRHPRATY